MKLRSITEAFRYPTLVTGRGSSDDASSQDRRQSQDQARDQRRDPREEDFSEAAVAAAVDAFGGDAQMQARGLQAQLQGQGPGLRVVLRDGTGAVIRQFTGEEFVRLRDAVSPESPTRGRLLDRKL